MPANHLLDRKPEDDYLAECAELLQKEKQGEEIKALYSVVIFRLFKEWLALSTLCFTEITDWRSIHIIPHRSNNILLGVVNLRGQLKLTVALHRLLEIESNDTTAYRRMVAISNKEEQWIFPVNEVHGIHRFDLNQLKNVPVTVSKSSTNFFKGMIEWEGKNVGLFDEGLLFSMLRRNLP